MTDVSLEVDARYGSERVRGFPFCYLMSTCNNTGTSELCDPSMTELVVIFPKMGFSQGNSRREGNGEKCVYKFA